MPHTHDCHILVVETLLSDKMNKAQYRLVVRRFGGGEREGLEISVTTM